MNIIEWPVYTFINFKCLLRNHKNKLINNLRGEIDIEL